MIGICLFNTISAYNFEYIIHAGTHSSDVALMDFTNTVGKRQLAMLEELSNLVPFQLMARIKPLPLLETFRSSKAVAELLIHMVMVAGMLRPRELRKDMKQLN